MVYKLKFYANTPNGEVNKRFTWIISDWTKISERLRYFQKKGFTIIKAYYEVVNDEGKKGNHEIDLKIFLSD
jgi:hypothetical protein